MWMSLRPDTVGIHFFLSVILTKSLWLGIAAPRNALLDRLLPLPGWLTPAMRMVADLAVRDGSPRHDTLRLASAYAEIMGV